YNTSTIAPGAQTGRPGAGGPPGESWRPSASYFVSSFRGPLSAVSARFRDAGGRTLPDQDTGPRRSRKGDALPASLHVPELEPAISAVGGQRAPVGQECHRQDLPFVPPEGEGLFPG